MLYLAIYPTFTFFPFDSTDSDSISSRGNIFIKKNCGALSRATHLNFICLTCSANSNQVCNQNFLQIPEGNSVGKNEIARTFGCLI